MLYFIIKLVKLFKTFCNETTNYQIQLKPLNVITLRDRETDSNNQIITLTEQTLRSVNCKNATWASID
jgi:hypothetical protein